MILIQIPDNYQAERYYILSVMFQEFLGLDIQVKASERRNLLITMNNGRELIVADGLFSTNFKEWLQPSSLPKQPLKIWNLATTKLNATTVNIEIPVIYGEDPSNPDFFQQSEEKISLGLDIFGSAFFMLTRYEEVVKTERDRYKRFPGTASLGFQEGFLDRPIINEYLEILWACLKHLCHQLERKPRQFKIDVTHDVDLPFMFAFTGVSRLFKSCLVDILQRKTPIEILNNFSRWIQVKRGNFEADPFYTFDLIMDISEKHNLKSAFYFLTADSGGDIKRYDIHHPIIRSLLRKIHQRGHEIGLHTSFNTYKDAAQTKKEFKILKQVCTEEDIQQEYWGGRQHYLRWSTQNTLQNWEDAELNYDSTLSFADVAGFRCGVCYEFPTFNIITRQALKLRERALIIMECTILDKGYMNLGYDSKFALETMAKYKKHCQIFSGNFILLWHNNRFLFKNELDIYQQLLTI